MIPTGEDIEHADERCSLSRGGAQCADTALKSGNFCLDSSNCRVGDALVHVSVSSQVKQLCNLCGGFIFIRSALIDRQGQRFTVSWCIAGMQALSFNLHCYHPFQLHCSTACIFLQEYQKMFYNFVKVFWVYKNKTGIFYLIQILP